MLLGPVKRAIVSWIAILAVLMASLAPTISHAVGTSSPTSWADICTSTGAKRVSVDGDAAGKSSIPGAAHLLEHCPSCSLHADTLGMPPAPAATITVVLMPAEVPAAFLHAERTLDVWASAQPRAPPVLG